MSATTLAINGGQPLRTKPFGLRRTMGEAEKKAVLEVMDSDSLSGFFGSPGPFAFGGEKVRAFEAKWADRFGYKHVITTNSWTTGLMTCVGAAGIGPGDEVICPPFTMSATSTSVLFYGGIPVFADLSTDDFCLDPEDIERKITPRTRAIMVVHLFGQAANMDAINSVAKNHNLKVIEDAAHAPCGSYKGQPLGSVGDLGGFSLNFHKHIHCGEGGVIVTNDDDLALRCQLIRNHAENLVNDQGITDLTNMIGSNYRMTELQAAIAMVQMDKVSGYVATRNHLHRLFSELVKDVPGITPACILPDRTHSFYVYPILFDEKLVGVSREKFVEAVKAELPAPSTWEQTPLSNGYVQPLYLAPVYQKQIALGSKGFPFNYNEGVSYDYAKGSCPVTEEMADKTLMVTPLIREPLVEEDMIDFANAIKKVIENAGQIT